MTYKLITCIAPEDRVRVAVDGLSNKYGIQAMVYHYARGFGRSSPLVKRGLGQQTEKVIISVLVSSKQADDIFAYIYQAADLNRPHGGIIYITAISKSKTSPHIDIPKKAAESE